ncbi:hypothetical protein RIF29_11536 [Crotalaria pallida]|uniref:Uncharacterized protein n=1 Tax=Crotalaria pallida TaxID=3830 RepID=A0AAN9P043_CROPI
MLVSKNKKSCKIKNLHKRKKKQELIAWKDFWIDLRIDSEAQIRKEENNLSLEGNVRRFNDEDRTHNVVTLNVADVVQPELAMNVISGYTGSSAVTTIPNSQEAVDLWNIGQQLGVLGKGNDSEVISRLAELEAIDNEERRKRSRA